MTTRTDGSTVGLPATGAWVPPASNALQRFKDAEREQLYVLLVSNHLVTDESCRSIVLNYPRLLYAGEPTLANLEAALVKKQPQITAAVKEIDGALANCVESETSDLPGLVKKAISTLLGAIKESRQVPDRQFVLSCYSAVLQESGRLDTENSQGFTLGAILRKGRRVNDWLGVVVGIPDEAQLRVLWEGGTEACLVDIKMACTMRSSFKEKYCNHHTDRATVSSREALFRSWNPNRVLKLTETQLLQALCAHTHTPRPSQPGCKVAQKIKSYRFADRGPG
eukprot:COSAG02_NODE_16017_length_1120_cov_1.816846_1_plen_280_part_10